MLGMVNNGNKYTDELGELFSQRAVLVFWLGILFYMFFSVLDYLVHPEFFFLFLVYRLAFVCFLLLCLGLLHFRSFKRYARQLMAIALVFASLTISLMILELGGFKSEYYIGIVLVAAFVFSVLPLTVPQVLALGLAVYLVYIFTLVEMDFTSAQQDVVYILNNTFFYFAIFIATTVKCYDDGKIRREIWKGRSKVRHLQTELSMYTGNLEAVVQRRLEQIKDLEFRYSELYENIQDMVVVVGKRGDVRLFNRRFASVFGLHEKITQNYNLFDFLAPVQRKEVSGQLVKLFTDHSPFLGVEIRMVTAEKVVWTVEMSGTWVNLDALTPGCQLVLRNITQRKEIEQQMLESTRLVDKSRRTAILGLAKLAEYRDSDTGAHLERIREYTRMLTEVIAERNNLQHLVTPLFLEDITLSSVLHDIGKVGIPDAILLKPGKLTKEEFDTMKLHCVYGRDALAEAERDAGDVSFLTMGQEIAHFHHEKWDGSGYPLGLSGTNIPLSARIVALADVYDALTSKRCYKSAFSHEQAREIILENRGSHFDPDVIEAFLKQEPDFKRIRLEILLQ